MNEHEKLKEICDKIGYNLSDFTNYYDSKDDEGFLYYWAGGSWDGEQIYLDVREIIFTPEFMATFISYCDIQGIIVPSKYKIFLIDLHRNLNDPVDYLYKLIIGTEKS